MEDPIEFARKCKHKEVRRARDYSKENGHKDLEFEASVIDGMIRPESWESLKFARAILGNYVLLWEKNGVLLPADWTGKKVNEFREALQEYLDMPQGWLWVKRYSAHWVAGMVRAGRAMKRLEISLRADEVAELERMARVLGVDGIDGAGLATLWIKQQLVRTRSPFPRVNEN